MQNYNKKGFTLIELIIVIAIISIIYFMAAPRFASVIQASRTAEDNYNLRILNDATRTYAVINNINRQDIFEGLYSNSGRIEILMAGGFIGYLPEPNQENKKYNWIISDQEWILGNEADESHNPSDIINPPNYPLWQSDMVYHGGDRVLHNGRLFVARYGTHNDTPGLIESPWQEITNEWRFFNIYHGGAQVIYNGKVFIARNWTQNHTPGLVESPWQEDTENWRFFNIYVAGDEVYHNGEIFRAKWYTQNDTPGSSDVWQRLT